MSHVNTMPPLTVTIHHLTDACTLAIEANNVSESSAAVVSAGESVLTQTSYLFILEDMASSPKFSP